MIVTYERSHCLFHRAMNNIRKKERFTVSFSNAFARKRAPVSVRGIRKPERTNKGKP